MVPPHRFPLDTGIAGYVATSGLTLNVADVSRDERFNANIDQEVVLCLVTRYCSRKPSQTGYMTKSLLCLPITVQGATIGVLQLVNKVGGGGASFTAEDEARVRSFSVYCGLALHHAKLLDKIRRSEQKLKVRRFQSGEGP